MHGNDTASVSGSLDDEALFDGTKHPREASSDETGRTASRLAVPFVWVLGHRFEGGRNHVCEVSLQ
jgi:hypothetical protein